MPLLDRLQPSHSLWITTTMCSSLPDILTLHTSTHDTTMPKATPRRNVSLTRRKTHLQLLHPCSTCMIQQRTGAPPFQVGYKQQHVPGAWQSASSSKPAYEKHVMHSRSQHADGVSGWLGGVGQVLQQHVQAVVSCKAASLYSSCRSNLAAQGRSMRVTQTRTCHAQDTGSTPRSAPPRERAVCTMRSRIARA